MSAGRYAELFLSESSEHLSVVNDALLTLERGEESADAVRELFRAVHSMKGMAGAMGFQAITALAHEMESLLDAIRSGRLPVDAERVDALFAASDLLGDAVAAAMEGAEERVECGAVLERLRALSAAGADVVTPGGAPAAAADAATEPSGVDVRSAWSVTVHQDPAAPLRGARAFLAIRRLEGVGRVVGVRPSLQEIQEEAHGDRFTVFLVPADGADAARLESAARSAGDVVGVEVASPGSAPSTPVVATEAGPAAPRPAAPDPAGWELPATTVRKVARSVRVDVRHLDTLLDLAGELLIGRERLAESLGSAQRPAVKEALSHLSRLVSDLQHEVLQARLVPVWQVFDRFPRVVRDSARALGKEVEFVVEGKEIELDRSLLDEIGEPVVHLLRNAMDHGLELPGERVAAGKPRAGRLTLSAVRERDSVLVRVTDDGRGIDRSRVLERARDLGLVGAGEEPDVQGLIRLISRPGFSTAERVTEISGRGVGMDAVQDRLRALGGSVEIQTEPGAGTSITLRMPLTLAIIRTLLARVGDEVYAFPVSHVSGTADMAAASASSVWGESVLTLGDEVLPSLRLRELVGLPAEGAGEDEIVVLQTHDRRLGLVVDELLGEHEAVVKRFDPVRGGLACFSGAAVLGNGMPALIVDVGRLLT